VLSVIEGTAEKFIGRFGGVEVFPAGEYALGSLIRVEEARVHYEALIGLRVNASIKRDRSIEAPALVILILEPEGQNIGFKLLECFLA